MHFELRVVHGECAGYQKSITKPERILIGRESTCDLTLSDPLLSRQHCLVEFKPNEIKVIDLKSRNGTFVNGQRIQETRVTFQDEIKVGRHLLQVFSPPAPTNAAKSQSARVTLCSRCGNRIGDSELREMRAIRHGSHFYCENCIGQGIEGQQAVRVTRQISQSRRPVPLETLPTESYFPAPDEPRATETIPQAQSTTPARQRIGAYEVMDILGEGGMGVVYKARHTFLDTVVAIKVIKEEMATHADILKRFLQEAKLGVGLDHPNILRIHDAGESEGMYFIAMEYFPGDDIALLVKKTAPLSYQKVMHLAIQMADALSYAHERGVIHRDVKPSNILIDANMQIAKLADFGLAKAWQNAGAHHLTASGQTLGTIQYISPEQLEDSRNVDPQTDIFSLGASLYFTLAGTPPFGEEPIGRVIQNILHNDPPKLPNIPDSLYEVLLKAMAKKRAERFATMKDLKESLIKLSQTICR